VLYRELKVGRNRLSVEQGEWLDALAACGCDAGVWHELDWRSGHIEAELRPSVPTLTTATRTINEET
jgi:hypothetical protein